LPGSIPRKLPRLGVADEQDVTRVSVLRSSSGFPVTQKFIVSQAM
jgi:hypothetical protein